jgi:hypothetical protein
VHGDVSPKNILVGPQGPVLLDAECAWWGDPAFDLAFCLNHLLLKACGRRRRATTSWPASTRWPPLPGRRRLGAARGGRAACRGMLPGLLLARVDGKSPVEYITRTPSASPCAACAPPLLHSAARFRLADISAAWRREIER